VLLNEIWGELQALPSVASLLTSFDEADVDSQTTAIERAFSAGERPELAEEDRLQARTAYEAAERLVLRQIAAGALRTRERGAPSGIRTRATALKGP
jgi:hypothetical protein